MRRRSTLAHAFLAAVAVALVAALPYSRAQAQGSGSISITSGDRQDSTRRAPPAIPVTAEHLRTAFADTTARMILTRARAGRISQDSALRSYDVRGYQRVSAGLSFSAQGRDRLAFRREGATRMKWVRDVGALVEVEGARAVAPLTEGGGDMIAESGDARSALLNGAMRLPYFPGSEALWIGSDVVRTDINDRSLIHPLAAGAEAYYRYGSGGTIRYTLPDGQVITALEMIITPREPTWNVVVGAFWFETDNYQLVRAVYRLAVPLDAWTIDVNEGNNVGTAVARAILSPIRGTVNAITIEHALFNGRFWLPLQRTAQGFAQISVARIPFELQQRYDYISVNEPLDIPVIPLTEAMARADSVALRDSLAALDDESARARARELSERLAARVAPPTSAELRERAERGDTAARAELARREERFCGTSSDSTEVRYSRVGNRSVRVMSTATCDLDKLMNSDQLPPSIYSEDDILFNPAELESMIERLGMGMQAGFAPQKPSFRFGFGDGLLRYNRVEGLSPGVAVQQAIGAGIAWNAVGRYGFADGEFNGELGVNRSNGRSLMQLNGYRRLIAINDWGNPLSFGSSLQALLFGRDEGFYYRGTGAELIASVAGNPYFEWKLYGERQRVARRETDFSVAGLIDDREFMPNVEANRADIFGAAFRVQHSLGTNPSGLRLLTQIKGENGLGDYSFSRGMIDATVSSRIAGKISGALTLSGGSTTGTVPVQRYFSLGGTQSVRGQRSGTAMGDAFWMTRVEIGTGYSSAKRALFADAGWAGSRQDWGRQSRAMSSVGLGWSFLDGLIRFDLARGIYPGRSWRFASYLEARF